MNSTWHINNLIPAHGWVAVFANDDYTDFEPATLIGWALVSNDEGRQNIYGVILADEMDGDWLYAPLSSRFLGYHNKEYPLSREHWARLLEVAKD